MCYKKIWKIEKNFKQNLKHTFMINKIWICCLYGYRARHHGRHRARHRARHGVHGYGGFFANALL